MNSKIQRLPAPVPLQSEQMHELPTEELTAGTTTPQSDAEGPVFGEMSMPVAKELIRRTSTLHAGLFERLAK